MGYTVSLHNLQRAEDVHYSTVEFGDTFSFRQVPAGEYSARVYNAVGELQREEFVRVAGNTVARIELSDRRVAARPTGARVSVRQLSNPPTKKAFQTFQKACKYSAAGQMERAAAELEKAIGMSPSFAAAHTNLAAMHLRMQHYQQALDEATLAIRLDSPNAIDLANIALAQWGLRRFDEALQAAGQALRLDPSSMTGHFVLGSLLAGDPKTLREGIRHLEVAARRYPQAAKNLEVARAAAGGARGD